MFNYWQLCQIRWWCGCGPPSSPTNPTKPFTGTVNQLAKFTGPQTIGDSIISDNGSLITVAGDLAAIGDIAGVNLTASGNISGVNVSASGNVTVGALAAASGSFVCRNGQTLSTCTIAPGTGDISAVGDVPSGDAFTTGLGSVGNNLYFHNGFEGNLTAGVLTTSRTYTLPNEDGSFCLEGSTNCGFQATGSYAFTNLNNLAAVAINTSLLPGVAGGVNLGSGTLPFGTISLSGTSGAPGTNNFLLTGSSTAGTRTITLPDLSGTVCVSGSTCSTAGIVGYWSRGVVSCGSTTTLCPATSGDIITIPTVPEGSSGLSITTANTIAGTTNALLLTTGTLTTAGTQQNALNISTGAADLDTSLNAINIGNASGASLAKTAINLGSGWNTGINLSSIPDGATGINATLADATTPTTGISLTSGNCAACGSINLISANVPTAPTITAPGTINGFNFGDIITGPAAGSLNAINIGNISNHGTGTETAINIGSGWDTGVKINNVFTEKGVDIEAPSRTSGTALKISSDSTTIAASSTGRLFSLDQTATYQDLSSTSATLFSVSRNLGASSGPTATVQQDTCAGSVGSYNTKPAFASLSWAHTVCSDPGNLGDHLLVVGISTGFFSGTISSVQFCLVSVYPTCTGPTFTLTFLGSISNAGPMTTSVYYLKISPAGPPVGTGKVTINLSAGPPTFVGGSTSWYNVNNVTPIVTPIKTNTGTGNSPNVAITSNNTQAVEDFVTLGINKSDLNSPTPPQSDSPEGWHLKSLLTPSFYIWGGSSVNIQPTSSMSWGASTSFGTPQWVIAAIAINSVSSGGTETVTVSGTLAKFEAQCNQGGNCVDSSNILFLNQANTASSGAVLSISNSATGINAGPAILLPTTTNISGGIKFGADTTLYRSAANTLKTEGDLVVGNNIQLNGTLSPPVGLNDVLCRDSTNFLASCTANVGGSPPTSAFVHLAPNNGVTSVADVDPSIYNSIYINKTGLSGDLLHLCTGASCATNKFVVNFAGNVTAAGTYNTNTFTGTALTFGGTDDTITSVGKLTITPAGAFTLGATGQAFNLQGSSASTIKGVSGGNTTTVGFTTPTGARAINLPDNSGIICLEATSSCGFVPTSRTLTAGAGLTGGGDLTANRTFDVVGGNGIATQANNIELGPLTANWDQTGAFDIVLNNSGSELIIRDSDNTNNLTIDAGNLTADRSYSFPDSPLNPTDTVCLFSLGNCAGSGTGVTTSGGTATRVAFFTASQAIGDDVNFYWDNTAKGLVLGSADTSADARLEIQPSTAAALQINQYGTGAGQTGELRLQEGGGSPTNYTGFKAPDSIASNLIYTLPTSLSDTYILQTNGSGVLSWVNPTGGGIGAGDITDVGDVASGPAFTAAGTAGTSLWFYDAQGRGQLTVADLTAAQTYTLPDSTGTFVLLQPNVAGTATAQVATGSQPLIYLNENGASTPNLLQLQQTNTDVLIVDNNGNLLANAVATANNATTEASNRDDVTTVTLTAGAFVNNDVIKTTRSGVGYYTRIVSGGGTATLIVSPTVSYDLSSTVTKVTTQNIGASQASQAAALRYFQGYFLGGIVTGSASTTYADRYINVTSGTLNINTTNNQPITTGTGLLTLGGNLTFSGTTARTITGPTTGGLTMTVGSGPITLSTTTSGTLAISSAGVLNLTGNGASTWQNSGGALTIQTTSQNLTLQTVTSGNLSITAAGTLALSTSASNSNITLAPNGTGAIQITSGVTGGTGTSSGLSIAANSVNSGTAIDLSATSLTSGIGINLSSSATAFTGNLAKITLSGSNANNTGSLLSIENTGTLNTNTALYVKHYATGAGNLALRVDDVSGDTTPFVIDGTGNVGIGITTPTQLLHLASSGNPAIRYEATSVSSPVTLSKGPNSPTVAANSGSGTAWVVDPTTCSPNTLIGCVAAGEGKRAQVTLPGAGNSSQYLQVTGFSFTSGQIPSSATITGVVVEVKRLATVGSEYVTNDSSLLKGGATCGLDQDGQIWSSFESYNAFGSTTNTWSCPLTPADVTAGGFGYQVQAQCPLGCTGIAKIDHIRITVYYYINTWVAGADASNGARFKISNSDTLGTNDYFTLDQNGRVGIGTTSPQATLDVRGNALFGYATNLSYIGLFGLGDIHNAFTFGSVNFLDNQLGIGNNSIVTDGNNVGIGTTSPGFRLDVQGTQASTYVAQIKNTDTSNTADGLRIDLGVANASRGTGNYFIGFSGAGTVAGKIQGGASAVAYTTTAADYAEFFRAANLNDLPQPGELVSLDPSSNNSVIKSSLKQDTNLIGIVSTNPGFIGNGPLCLVDDKDCDKNYAKYNSLVALNGQIPTKVSTENGPIAIGDPLTSSSIPGVAMKATQSGPTVGKALESYSNPDQTAVGKIMVFVSVGWYVQPLADVFSSQYLVSSNLDKLTVRDLTATTLFIGDRKISLAPTGELVLDGGLNVLGDTSLTGNLKVDGTILAKSLSVEKINVATGLIDQTTSKSRDSTGNNTIAAGQSQVGIETTAVTAKSRVFVTATTSTGGQSIYVSEKRTGDGFTVKIDNPVINDVRFDWLVIN